MPTQLTPFIFAILLLIPAGLFAQSSPRQRAMAPYRAGLDHLEAEAFEEAVKSFGAAIDLDATFELAHYMLGRAHLSQKQFVQAAAALTRARDLYRTGAVRQFSSAQDAQLARRDKIAEVDELIRQLEQRPQSTAIQNQLRQLNDHKRRIEDSVHRGNGDMSVTMPVPAFVTLSLGSAYFRMGDLAQAEKAYVESIAVDPKSGEAHNNLAVVYLETGRYDEADKAVHAAEKAGIRVNPQLKEDIRKRKREGSSELAP